jgi:hypothetical protein
MVFVSRLYVTLLSGASLPTPTPSGPKRMSISVNSYSGGLGAGRVESQMLVRTDDYVLFTGRCGATNPRE